MTLPAAQGQSTATTTNIITTSTTAAAVATTAAVTLEKLLVGEGLDPARILRRGTDDYEARQGSYFSRCARDLQPACIAKPRSAAEVALVVRALGSAGVRFAVRSGGHTNWAGANGIGPDGVTVDLGDMDWVRVVKSTVERDAEADAEARGGDKQQQQQQLVDIGPGCRWGRVYTALEAEGLTVAGGREGNVGVAGLVLGGGMAFYTARHGLACDNVAEFEVVLADGRIIKAAAGGSSSTSSWPSQNGAAEHAELFRCLKGGGNNFGIVTNFRMRALPARPAWAGMTVHAASAVPAATAALVRFASRVERDPDSNLLCFFTHAPQLGPHVRVVGALIQVAGVERAPAYDEWLAMPGPVADTCKPTSIAQLAADYTQAQDYYNTWFTATFKNDARVVARAAELHAALVEELRALIPDGDFVTQCLLQPFPRLFGRLSAASGGGNVTGIDAQAEDALVLLAVAQVRTAALHGVARAKVRAWVGAVEAYAAAVGAAVGWTYLNYADGSQDPLASYGAENVRLMRRVAARYDPLGVFQRLCAGGFKISDVAEPEGSSAGESGDGRPVPPRPRADGDAGVGESGRPDVGGAIVAGPSAVVAASA